MLGTAPLIAFVGVSDLDRAKSFYQSKLGLDLVGEEPSQALVFQFGKTLLRVSLVPRVSPTNYTALGWIVENMDEIVDCLTERGITFERFPGLNQSEHGVWTAPDGALVSWFKDPDGNLLSLTQFPRLAP